jgi:hypothetical protein
VDVADPRDTRAGVCLYLLPQGVYRAKAVMPRPGEGAGFAIIAAATACGAFVTSYQRAPPSIPKPETAKSGTVLAGLTASARLLFSCAEHPTPPRPLCILLNAGTWLGLSIRGSLGGFSRL